MDKSELDILLRQIRLEERIIGDKENRNMDGSTVSFPSERAALQSAYDFAARTLSPDADAYSRLP